MDNEHGQEIRIHPISKSGQIRSRLNSLNASTPFDALQDLVATDLIASETSLTVEPLNKANFSITMLNRSIIGIHNDRRGEKIRHVLP
jgi:hypothetical protein